MPSVFHSVLVLGHLAGVVLGLTGCSDPSLSQNVSSTWVLWNRWWKMLLSETPEGEKRDDQPLSCLYISVFWSHLGTDSSRCLPQVPAWPGCDACPLLLQAHSCCTRPKLGLHLFCLLLALSPGRHTALLNLLCLSTCVTAAGILCVSLSLLLRVSSVRCSVYIFFWHLSCIE